MSERLAVRLGPDADAVRHHRAANDALLAVFRVARTPDALLDGVKAHEDVEAANTAFNEAHVGFLAAAAKTAGARLP